MEFKHFGIILLCFIVGVVAPKPPAPQMTLSSTSPTTLTLSITAPPGVSDLKGYKFQYSEVGGKKVQKDIGAVSEHVLEGLKPNTPYRVRIQTKSRSGSSKFSGWVNQKTMEDALPPPAAIVLPEAPQNLVATPRTTTAVVSWEAPPDNGAEVGGYAMAYGPLDNPTANRVDLGPSNLQTELDGLTDNTQYQVSLTAYNDGGDSRPVTVEFQTLEEKFPPPPVENIQATATETSVEVSWTIPTTTSADAIESIDVSFGAEGTDMDVSNFASNTNSFMAEQLSPGTSYAVAVVTVNIQGQSSPVTTTVQTLVPAAVPVPTDPPVVVTDPPRRPPPPVEEDVPIPEMPQNLKATSVTEISARLMWQKPIDNGAPIVGYVIAYGPMDDPTANTQTVNPSPTSFDLYGLQTDIQFSVYVTAYNQKGQSLPAEVEFWTTSGRAVPPQVEAVQSYPTENSVYITWTLPQTDGSNEIETIRLGFGPYGTSVDYLPFINLAGDAQQYTAERLAPGTSFTVAIISQNSEGDSDPVMLTVQTERPTPVATRPPPPDKGYEGDTPPSPVRLTATVLSPTTIRVDFDDPTMQGRTDIRDERYYRLRYKKEDDRNYQYMNIRDTPYTLEYLEPEATYEIDVKLVIDRETESPFTETALAFTGENVVRDVTAVQQIVTGPGRVKAIINWLPPENTPRPITGYAVEYAQGYYVTSRSEFYRVLVDTPVPKAIIENLEGDSTYHVRVAPRFGSGIGRFSDPPDAFATPPIPLAGQPLHCDGQVDGVDEVRERVIWMRGRSGMVGVPLPYCDDYYGVHECHGSVCFCIPGSPPPGSRQCRGGTRVYGDDPNAYYAAAPCHAEYEAALEAIDLASKTGKPLIEIRLPYCSQDGYYQSKQCLGSM